MEKKMAKAGVVFVKDNEYYTPRVFIERFGKFDYDPATTKANSPAFGSCVMKLMDVSMIIMERVQL